MDKKVDGSTQRKSMAQSTRKRTSGTKTRSSSTSNTNRRKKGAGTGTRRSTGTSAKTAGTRKTSSRSGSSRKRAALEKARRQNKQRSAEIRMDILLVLTAVIMVIIYVSLAGFGASVGSALRMILFGMFGIGAWVVPLWILVLCVCLITQQGSTQMPVRLIAAALLILVLQSAGHLYLHTAGRISLDVPFDLKETFIKCGENSYGGGIIGGWFSRLIYRAFGVIGSGLVYFGIAVIALMLLLQRSPAGAVRSWRERREEEGIPGFSERREMRRRRRQQMREEAEEERLSREADRILIREDRAAAKAQQRREREQNAQMRRERRRSNDSRSLDLEHMKLDENNSEAAFTENRNSAGRNGRRSTNAVNNLDRRRDVHEIVVLTQQEENMRGAAEEDFRTEPEGTVYRRSSYSAGNYAAEEIPVVRRSEESLAGDIERIPGGGSMNIRIPDSSANLTEKDPLPKTGQIDVIASAARNVEDRAAGAAVSAANTAAGSPSDPETNNVVKAVPAAGSGSSNRLGTGTFNPSEEDLEGISVHRDKDNANTANRIPARTAATRKGTNYVPPTFSLLKRGNSTKSDETERELKETAYRLQETLRTFGVQVTITDISQGPSVTRYELKPDKGVKVSKIVNLSDDIKLRLAASDIRIEAPIPGKSAIGIEVPNRKETTLQIRELLESKEFRGFQGKVPFAVGKDIVGKNVITDIARMPHLLIAGATGSGKSVCINTIIMSILYKTSPEKVRLLLIDPKVVELSVYQKIPHLIIPVVTDVRKAAAALNWAVAEMQKRYNLFAAAGVRDLEGYNALAASYRNEDGSADRDPLPRIVIIVDELADLMMTSKNEVENAICRLAQLARAAGIHLIIATQRPSVDVITGLIKANMPSRIAFSVSSQIDSRTILDMAGAEKLIGRGDMLFYPQNYQKPARIQGAFISEEEVLTVVDYIRKHNEAGMHDKEIDRQIDDIAANGIADVASGEVRTDPARDEHFAEAGRFIIEKNKASIGLLQRVFKIGFNRAARIMDQLAEAGVVSEESSTRARQVLMTMPEFEAFLESENG